MVIVGVSFDHNATFSCKAPYSLRFQKKEDVIQFLCAERGVSTDDLDEILVIVDDNVTVWTRPF